MEKARRDRTGGLSGRSPDREIRRPCWGLWLKGTPLSWLRWCSPYPVANSRLRAEVPTTNSRAGSFDDEMHIDPEVIAIIKTIDIADAAACDGSVSVALGGPDTLPDDSTRLLLQFRITPP